MQAVSDNLLHFLDRQHRNSPNQQFNVFKSIIESGLRLGKINIYFANSIDFVTNHVACFTDIPLNLCDEHTAIYGKFGVGFKKSSIKISGGNPARYFTNDHPIANQSPEHSTAMLNNLRVHFKISQRLHELFQNDSEFALYGKDGKEIIANKTLKQWLEAQLTILSFEKEMSDLDSNKNGPDGIDRFYKEREWRLVPLVGNLNTGFMINSEGFYYYKFNRNDINVVITPNEGIRSTVLNYFLELGQASDQRLKEFAENPPPIISYDDLRNW